MWSGANQFYLRSERAIRIWQINDASGASLFMQSAAVSLFLFLLPSRGVSGITPTPSPRMQENELPQPRPELSSTMSYVAVQFVPPTPEVCSLSNFQKMISVESSASVLLLPMWTNIFIVLWSCSASRISSHLKNECQ